MTSTPLVSPIGFGHVRLTVTDIARSKAFYQQLFGTDPAFDLSDRIDEPGITDDPQRMYGGAGWAFGSNLLGLRPVAEAGDRFASTRVGLDHLSLQLESADDVRAAAQRFTDAGIEHGEPIELADFGMIILSVQDPDDINLELSAPL